jgi:hypothetical protein
MNRVSLRIFTAILAAFACINTIYAHHGRDFLFLETAHLPEFGGLYGISRQDFVREDIDEFEFEPGLIYGAFDWLALEVHGHVEKVSGESFNYESTAPALHLRFTPRNSALALGASVEYEFAREGDDEDKIEISGVSAFEKEDWIIGFNLNYEKIIGEDEEWGYAAGVRRVIGDVLSIGVEVIGSFEDEESGEVLCGLYGDLSDRLTINAGIGTGFNSEVDLTVRTALIWRFK